MTVWQEPRNSVGSVAKDGSCCIDVRGVYWFADTSNLAGELAKQNDVVQVDCWAARTMAAPVSPRASILMARHPACGGRRATFRAGVAELADAGDLKSSAAPCGVRVQAPAPAP